LLSFFSHRIVELIENDLEIKEVLTLFADKPNGEKKLESINTMALEFPIMSLILSITNLPNILNFKPLLTILTKISAILAKKSIGAFLT
jgi:hypothetical protein